MKPVEDLVVWRESVALLAEIHLLAKRLPAHEQEHLGERLFRAAVSVPAHIADGHDTGDRALFLNRLLEAADQLAELGAMLALAEQLGYVSPAELEALEQARESALMPLRGFIGKLRRDLPAAS